MITRKNSYDPILPYTEDIWFHICQEVILLHKMSGQIISLCPIVRSKGHNKKTNDNALTIINQSYFNTYLFGPYLKTHFSSFW